MSSFIKKDVNFGMLLIVIILAIAIAAIGIYFNQRYIGLSDNYYNQLDNLEKVTKDLVFHKSMLNETVADLKVKEQDESDLNRRYTELRVDKENVDKRNVELDASLKEKTAQLTNKINELVTAKSEVADQKAEIADQSRKIDVYKAKIDNLEEKLDSHCASYPDLC